MSLAMQWLRLRIPNVSGMGLIPDGATKILHAMWGSQKIMPRRGNLNTKINTQEECHVKRYRKKTATNNLRRKAWNTPFPHSPQKESTLLTP